MLNNLALSVFLHRDVGNKVKEIGLARFMHR